MTKYSASCSWKEKSLSSSTTVSAQRPCSFYSPLTRWWGPSSRPLSSPGWLWHITCAGLTAGLTRSWLFIVRYPAVQQVCGFPGKPWAESWVCFLALLQVWLCIQQLQLAKYHEESFENLREPESPPPIAQSKLLQKRGKERKKGMREGRQKGEKKGNVKESFFNLTSHTTVSTFLWSRNENELAKDNDDPYQSKEDSTWMY